MSKVIFNTRPGIEIVPGRGWETSKPVTFEWAGVKRTILKGFAYNGANIKWLFPILFLAPFDPRVARAALVHDWLYCEGDRRTADKLFRVLMRQDGLDPIRTWLMWAGVRIFGGLWMRWMLSPMLMLCLAVGCVAVPQVVKDAGGEWKLSQDKTRWLPAFSNAGHEYAEDVSNANGWVKPDNHTDEDAAELYIWMSAVCFAAAMVAFCIAYMTHQHSLVVVGGILMAGNAYAVGMAEIAEHLWILPVVIGLGLCWLGWRWRKKHITNALRNNKDGCP